MAVDLSLELMTIVGATRVALEWELFERVIHLKARVFLNTVWYPP